MRLLLKVFCTNKNTTSTSTQSQSDLSIFGFLSSFSEVPIRKDEITGPADTSTSSGFVYSLELIISYFFTVDFYRDSAPFSSSLPRSASIDALEDPYCFSFPQSHAHAFFVPFHLV